MAQQEKEYLNRITSSIALILNDDYTIRHINNFGTEKLQIDQERISGRPLARLADNENEHPYEVIGNHNWEQFFNAIPMPVFIKDRQHRWVFFNDALCNLQNKSRQELLNKNDYDFFPKTQADKFWGEEETIFKTGKEIFAEEPSLRNGTDSYVLIKKTIVKTRNGEEYLIGCCIDITKRKKAELALIESERRFRSLIRHSPDVIAIVGKNHLVQYLTPSFYRLFDFIEDEIIGTSILDIIHLEDQSSYYDVMEKVVSSPSKGYDLEIRVRKKNGDYLVLEAFIKDLSFDPAIDGIVMNCSDVTTIRNQSIEIERINALLKADNTELKAQLRHEIDTKVDVKPLSFSEFKKKYPDNTSCLHYLAELKWKNGFKCKKCRNTNYGHGKFDFSRRCSKCGYEETATTNTIFYRIKFPILEAFYLFFLLRSNQNFTAKELSSLTLIKEKTCWLFKRKITVILGKNKQNSENWEAQMLN